MTIEIPHKPVPVTGILPCPPDGADEDWDGRHECGEYLEWALVAYNENHDTFEIEAGCPTCGGPYCEGHEISEREAERIWGHRAVAYLRRITLDRFDVFISHASEDKDAVARPLAELLSAKGLRVWYDEFTLRLGDSLHESIERGLAQSRFGVVILSPRFLRKNWPKAELNGLVAREMAGRKVILPIWHELSKDDLLVAAPMLADKVAALTTGGLDQVAAKILAVLDDELAGPHS